MAAIHKNMKISEIYSIDKNKRVKLPLFLASVSAGFPSPAEDYIDKKIDLNEHLIEHDAATFFVKVDGNSMIDSGIHSGDILIVDRSLEVCDNKVVVAIIDGEFTVKRIKKTKDALYLMPDNKKFKPIKVTEDMDFEVWGVVTYVIHRP